MHLDSRRHSDQLYVPQHWLKAQGEENEMVEGVIRYLRAGSWWQRCYLFLIAGDCGSDYTDGRVFPHRRGLWDFSLKETSRRRRWKTEEKRRGAWPIDQRTGIQHAKAKGPDEHDPGSPCGGHSRSNHNGYRPQVSPGVQARSSFRQTEGLTWRKHWSELQERKRGWWIDWRDGVNAVY